MDIQFSLHGAPLLLSEAEALIQSSSNIKKPLEIDISDYFDVSDLDSGNLFELAVKTKNQDLASLAFKISVSKSKPSKSLQDQKKTKNTIVNIIPYKNSNRKLKSNVEDVIYDLNKSSSSAMIGAAIILKMVSQKDETTLRETAIWAVNTMWEKDKSVRSSKFFKGFELLGGKLEPIHLRQGIERRHTFHVSPLYIGLREGLAYCLQQGLVTSRKRLSTGSYKDKTPRSDLMQRVYYSFKKTEKGEELINLWADLDDYIYKGFCAQKEAA